MQPTHKNNQHNHQQDEVDSFDFKEALLRYIQLWPYFLASLSFMLCIAFIVNKLTPLTYKIEGKFLIKDEGNAMNLFDFDGSGSGGILPKGQKVSNEMIKLKSRVAAADALDQLPFDVEYYRIGLFTDKEIYNEQLVDVDVDWTHIQLANGKFKISWKDSLSYQFKLLEDEYQKFVPGGDFITMKKSPQIEDNTFLFAQWVELPHFKFKINFVGPDKEGELILKFRDRESLIKQYTSDNFVVAAADKTSSILSLSLVTHQPQKGRDFLNTLMQVFLESELDEKNSMARNTVKFIDSQLSGITDSLNYAESNLEKFRSKNRTINISTEGTTIFEKLTELEKSLSEERFKKNYFQNLQDYMIREDYSDLMVPSGMGIDDPVLNKLIEDLMNFKSEKSRFLATQTENSPTVLEVNRKISNLNTSIKEVLKNVNSNSGLLIADIETRISKIENQFGRLPETEQDLVNIKRKYAFNESIYTFLFQRRAEAAITLASNKPSNKIIEPAVLNSVPMKLKPMLNYFLALMLGLVVPIIVVVVVDLFTVTLRDVKNLEQRLKVAVLGYIGQNKDYPQLVVHTRPRASITEAFRVVRTNLNFVFPKQKQITIMITSSIAGEGKSFCAMNLASVYSISEKKTILVGCDMHKSFKFEEFNVSNEHGLSSYLSGQIDDFKSIIQKTEFKNLDILSPGAIPPNPSELLISEKFEDLVNRLKKEYEVIIFDSSPLGLTNEALYLTSIADVTIFMLRQNYSYKTFIGDINSLKEKKGVKNLFVVVNDVADKDRNYSGYGYGYYVEDKEKPKLWEWIFLKNKPDFFDESTGIKKKLNSVRWRLGQTVEKWRG